MSFKKLIIESLTIESLLNEISNELDFSSFKVKKILNPQVWNSENEVKPEIRKKLIEIAKDYYSSLKLAIPISDITLTGSLANYNWSKYSDFDVHILIATEKFGDKEDLIKDLLDQKTRSWNDKHNITIKDYDVELYIQGNNQPHHSTGVYSLLNEDWLVKPEIVDGTIDKDEVINKYNKVVKSFEDIEKQYNDEKYDVAFSRLEKLKRKIKKMRQIGLESGGEFSSENIAFKLLRRNQIMGKISNLTDKSFDKEMSIDEVINENQTIKCKNCNWSWKESESKKEDLYLCHKCGYNNEPIK
jgi:hypothetical protein